MMEMLKNKKLIARIVLAVILLLTAVLFACKLGLFKGMNLEAAREFIDSYGQFSAVIFILVFVVRTLLVVFPSTVLIVLGGSIFGPVLGFVYSMLSIFISATLAFFLSRVLGAGFVHRILKGKADKLHLRIEKHGFKIIFFMRISMVFPYDIMNFAAGLTKVKYKEFILGTLLGMAAEVFSLNYLGDNIRHPLSWEFAVAILLIIVTIAIPLVIKRKKIDSAP